MLGDGADFASLNLPLSEKTRNLIGVDAFELMKPSAFMVNLARGGVVDEKALLSALRAEKIAGAGLDVHELEGEGHVSPLAELDNVILTPHIGAGTVNTQYEIGEQILEIVSEHAAKMNST